jgi:hypothetical protein
MLLNENLSKVDRTINFYYISKMTVIYGFHDENTSVLRKMK